GIQQLSRRVQLLTADLADALADPDAARMTAKLGTDRLGNGRERGSGCLHDHVRQPLVLGELRRHLEQTRDREAPVRPAGEVQLRRSGGAGEVVDGLDVGLGASGFAGGESDESGRKDKDDPRRKSGLQNEALQAKSRRAGSYGYLCRV